MSGIEKIKNILEKESYLIEKRREVSLLSDNNGVIEPIDLEINKSLTLVEVLDDVNSLVKVNAAYPTKVKRKVEFIADLVVLDGEDYREILSLLDGIK